MDKNEIKLERVSQNLNDFDVPQTVPIFEIFVAMVAIGISIMFFTVPNFIQGDIALYKLMGLVFPQFVWAIMFSLGGITGSLGLLFRSNIMRVVGLIMLAGVYSVMAICYILIFPSIGAVVMAGIALFAVLSIPIIKYTGIGTSRLSELKTRYGGVNNDNR